MQFSTNGIARSKGYRFELKYSSWVLGEKAENPWYLYCTYENKKTGVNIGAYTELSRRFSKQEDAEAFCEQIVSGKVSIEDLRAAEAAAWMAYNDRKQEAAKQEFSDFIQSMNGLGINPAIIPQILKAANNLSEDARKMLYDEKVMGSIAAPEPPKMTLGEYLSIYQRDIDVCVVDADTGEHPLPCVCYLSPEELAGGDYEYEDWEQWVLTLPIDHIQDVSSCPMAVLNTAYSLDQTSFLLNEDYFESRQWKNLHFRAICAGAEFDARLAYLQEQTPFEVRFDANCMDAEDVSDRKTLCQMLSENSDVGMASYWGAEEEFYAYCLKEDPFDQELCYDESEIPIWLTGPGQGLAQTLEGKIAWAKHEANIAEDAQRHQHEPEKQAGKER